uniref:Uncharacterized protein n=1 Tax=Glossina austeni TaxID=7395 RepID=A0A1A9V004_GLOAU
MIVYIKAYAIFAYLACGVHKLYEHKTALSFQRFTLFSLPSAPVTCFESFFFLVVFQSSSRGRRTARSTTCKIIDDYSVETFGNDMHLRVNFLFTCVYNDAEALSRPCLSRRKKLYSSPSTSAISFNGHCAVPQQQ